MYKIGGPVCRETFKSGMFGTKSLNSLFGHYDIIMTRVILCITGKIDYCLITKRLCQPRDGQIDWRAMAQRRQIIRLKKGRLSRHFNLLSKCAVLICDSCWYIHITTNNLILRTPHVNTLLTFRKMHDGINYITPILIGIVFDIVLRLRDNNLSFLYCFRTVVQTARCSHLCFLKRVDNS